MEWNALVCQCLCLWMCSYTCTVCACVCMYTLMWIFVSLPVCSSCRFDGVRVYFGFECAQLFSVWTMFHFLSLLHCSVVKMGQVAYDVGKSETHNEAKANKTNWKCVVLNGRCCRCCCCFSNIAETRTQSCILVAIARSQHSFFFFFFQSLFLILSVQQRREKCILLFNRFNENLLDVYACLCVLKRLNISTEELWFCRTYIRCRCCCCCCYCLYSFQLLRIENSVVTISKHILAAFFEQR